MKNTYNYSDIDLALKSTDFVLRYCNNNHVHRAGIVKDFDVDAGTSIVPVVSVVVIAYNAEHYIKECLDSILKQKFEASFEVVVADDCSTDSTRSIIAEYKARFPDIIRLLSQRRNVGAAMNYVNALSVCRGLYIASVCGDDLFCDMDKLHKQCDALKSMPSAAMVYTGIYKQLESWKVSRTKYSRKARVIRKGLNNVSRPEWVQTCLLNDPICTATPMLTREAVSHILRGMDILFKMCSWMPVEDIGSWLFASQAGDALYIDEPMSVYRLHRQSVMAIVDDTRRLLNEIGTLRIKLAFLSLEGSTLVKSQDVLLSELELRLRQLLVASFCKKELRNDVINSLAAISNNSGFKMEKIGDDEERIKRELRKFRKIEDMHRSMPYFMLKKVAINWLGL